MFSEWLEAVKRTQREVLALLSNDERAEFVVVPNFGSNIYDWEHATFRATVDGAEEAAVEFAESRRRPVAVFQLVGVTQETTPRIVVNWGSESGKENHSD